MSAGITIRFYIVLWVVCTLTHSSQVRHQLIRTAFSSFAPRHSKQAFSALGLSSAPAHVEMMGFLGMGNNPMVGATVAIAVAIQQAMN